LINLYVAGEEDEVPMVDVKAEEGEEPRGYPNAPSMARMQDISQKTANTTKWPENLRRKTRPQEAAKHLIMHSTTHVVK
jgi:hypothetical protein